MQNQRCTIRMCFRRKKSFYSKPKVNLFYFVHAALRGFQFSRLLPPAAPVSRCSSFRSNLTAVGPDKGLSLQSRRLHANFQSVFNSIHAIFHLVIRCKHGSSENLRILHARISLLLKSLNQNYIFSKLPSLTLLIIYIHIHTYICIQMYIIKSNLKNQIILNYYFELLKYILKDNIKAERKAWLMLPSTVVKQF